MESIDLRASAWESIEFLSTEVGRSLRGGFGRKTRKTNRKAVHTYSFALITIIQSVAPGRKRLPGRMTAKVERLE